MFMPRITQNQQTLKGKGYRPILLKQAVTSVPNTKTCTGNYFVYRQTTAPNAQQKPVFTGGMFKANTVLPTTG
jgi:hypothetical protein